MARARTTKSIAKRHDLQYFRKPHPWRRWRRAAVFFCCAAAVLWVSLYAWDGTAQQLHNPGHLSASHALFENDCAKCHDGDGKGGFFKGVSDNACLKCHDAAIHHPNQATMISADGMHSADCVQCHTEHRGHELLMASSDQHCLQCHANLDAHLMKMAPKSGVCRAVTAFTSEGHPHFGRGLLAVSGSGVPVDPTVLRFNHKKHMSQVKPAAGQATNCTVCHATRPQAGLDLAAADDEALPQPPYKVAGERAQNLQDSIAAADDRRYTRQISYERDCIGCHRLDLPGKVGIPHAELSLVRARIESLSPDELKKVFPPPEPAGDTGGLDTDTTPAKTVNEDNLDSWDKHAADEKAQLPAEIWQERVRQRTKLRDALKPLFSGDPAKMLADKRLIQFYVVYQAGNSCLLCHNVTGDTTAGFDAATASAAPPRTVATGIPPVARRWFVNSEFNHDAHRDLSCIDCHAKAPNSEATSDMLLPDLDGQFPGSPEPGGKTVSCVSCHHADTAVGRGAPASCVTCHTFHDRTREKTVSLTAATKN